MQVSYLPAFFFWCTMCTIKFYEKTFFKDLRENKRYFKKNRAF